MNQDEYNFGSGVGSGNSNQITGIEIKGTIDRGFPLWRSLFQDSQIPQIVIFPFLFFHLIQVITISLWPFSSFWDGNTTMKYIRLIIFFTPTPQTPNYRLYFSIVTLGLNILAVGVINFQFIYYKYRRIFFKYLNLPLRFYFECVVAILFIPNLMITGTTFLVVCKGEKSALNYVSLIILIITLAFQSIGYVITQSLASKSIIINLNPLTNFDSTIIGYTVFTSITTVALYFILLLFENWAQCVAQIIHLGLNCYLCYYNAVTLPFISVLTTSAVTGWFVSSIFGDIVMITATFKPNTNPWLPLMHVYVTFAAVTFIAYFIHKFMIKSILKKINIEKCCYEKYEEYFNNLQLDQDQNKAYLYLRLAFEYYLPSFYSLALPQYIMDRYEDEYILGSVLHLVNFFPHEIKIRVKVESILNQKRTLDYISRFILYQIDSIKEIRMNTNSNIIKKRLSEIKNMARNLEHFVLYAIDNKVDLSYYEYLGIHANELKALMKEAIVQNPNNTKYYDLYVRYLIETEGNYPEAMAAKRKQSIIELEYCEAVDLPFKSLVNAFPRYLIDKIVDLKGQILFNMKKCNSDSNVDSRLQKKASVLNVEDNDHSTDLDYNDEIEEQLARDNINDHRIRLALNRMLMSKLPQPLSTYKWAILCVSIYMICMVGGGYIYIWHSSDKFMRGVPDPVPLLHTIFNTAVANIEIALEYFRNNGWEPYEEKLKKLVKPGDKYIINPFENMLKPIMKQTTNSTGELQSLFKIFAQYAIKGEDILTFTWPMLKIVTGMQLCYPNGTQFERKLKTSYGSLVSMMQAYQREMSKNDTIENFFRNPDICEIVMNLEFLHISGDYLYHNISLHSNVLGEYYLGEFLVIELIVPILTGIVIMAPIIGYHIAIVAHFKKLLRLISEMKVEDKTKAKDRIMIISESEKKKDEARSHDPFGSSSMGFKLIFSNGVLALTFLIIIFTGSFMTRGMLYNTVRLSKWFRYASARIFVSAEALNALIYAVIAHTHKDNYTWSEIYYLTNLTKKLVDKMDRYNFYLVNGYNDTEACLNWDPIIDDNNLYSELHQSESLEQFYYNGSINQQIDIFKLLTDNILKSILDDDDIDPNDLANIFYMTNYRMWAQMFNVSDRFIYRLYIRYPFLIWNFYMFGSISAAFLLVLVFIFVLFYKNRVATYRAILFTIKRFPPQSLAQSALFDKIFLKGKDKDDGNRSIEYSIIKNSNDAIFMTNIYGVIESCNNSVQKLLGYAPSQVIGQKISLFFVNTEVEAIRQKMEMVSKKQSSAYSEDSFTVVNDGDKNIPVLVTTIGMKTDGNDVNSFVFIMRDQTKLLKQQHEAEIAKKRSENLLYTILPRDIVHRLNKGEKEITFVVDSATIIFIDINKFSDYATNLSPHEIMVNLGYYFAEVDKTLNQYRMLTKIKLIGDIYMAAGGLFHQDSEPWEHAEETVNFATDVLDIMEDINTHLNSQIDIRIGINTGGPLIAGVLGTDKPLFDIIGDPINVAARLQSTCEVGNVHVSQSTVDQIKGRDFEIETRGETFLKGKGKQTTYYVIPKCTVPVRS